MHAWVYGLAATESVVTVTSMIQRCQGRVNACYYLLLHSAATTIEAADQLVIGLHHFSRLLWSCAENLLQSIQKLTQAQLYCAGVSLNDFSKG